MSKNTKQEMGYGLYPPSVLQLSMSKKKLPQKVIQS